MSDTVVVTIRTDRNLKNKAQKVLKSMGLNLSVVVNAYLQEVVRAQKVEFSLDERPSEHLLDLLIQAKQDKKKKKLSPAFSTSKDAVAWLHSKKKTYAGSV